MAAEDFSGLFRHLDGLRLDVRMNIVEDTVADAHHIRLRAYSGAGRDIDSWGVHTDIDNRYLRLRLDGREGLVRVVSDAIRRSAESLIRGIIFDKSLPLLPFALFATEHDEGADIKTIVPSMHQLWYASPEQHEFRRAQVRRLTEWARVAP